MFQARESQSPAAGEGCVGEAVWLAMSVVYAQVREKYGIEIGTRAQ